MNDEPVLGVSSVWVGSPAPRGIPRSRLDDNDLVPYDVFRGGSSDRLGDGGFADPRETKLIDAINKALLINRHLGDPLGLGDEPLGGGGRVATEGPAPPPGDTWSPAYLDP